MEQNTIQAKIRTTKFPYVFWFFNTSYQCKIDLQNNIYQNLDRSTEYRIKKLNKYVFLFLKYFPIVFLMFFAFNIYDFIPNKQNMIAYGLAFLMVCSINFLEDLMRKSATGALIIIAIALGISTGETFLICAYLIKYFILLSVILLFAIDCKYNCFCILKNEKTISNFLLKNIKDK